MMVEMEQETIYGTHEDSHVVMSDKVQSLAGSIYQEFEKMISKYDEDVVKDLMPLVVNVLECLDVAYTENQEHQVEVELLREDNEQLVTQYEREKQLRKVSEQKLLEVEDLVEDERKEKGGKIESLESIVKILELKSKNASDHVYRLEEKEQEMKKEFSKLHERYTELFKTHMDYIERANILMGTNADRESRTRMPQMSLAHMNRSSGPVSFGFQSLESSVASRVTTSPGDFQPPLPASPPDSNHSPLRNQLEGVDSPEEEVSEGREKGWSETMSPKDQTSPDTSEESPLPRPPITPPSRTTTNKEQRIGNTLYQELSFQDSEALSEMDEGADITGNWVHPGEYASSVNDNFFGMGKEVENLIMENHELLETKNALNIVKDDLIIKVDELTSEQEILREELKSLNALKARLILKVSELEEELKKAREELEKATKSSKSDDEEDVPMAQRKRFTRVEMARVLMERNQYKERYMELQEAVRFTEMIRASRQEPSMDKKNKNNIWGFFSSLFSSSGGSGDKMMGRGRVGYHGAMAYHSQSHHLSPALDTMRKRSLHDRRRGLEITDNPASDLTGREELRCVRAHVGRREDGRLQAYGWSLPAAPTPRPPPKHPPPSNHVPVPVPVYCRPLMEKDDSMKMWCAAAVNLTGGKTRDGGSIVGASIFYSNEDESEPSSIENHNPSSLGPVEQLEQDLKDGEKGMKERDKQVLSSLVWICTSTRSVSYVTVIDANNPADILEVFSVCQSCLLCIASVPGANENDYKDETEEPVVEGEGVADVHDIGIDEEEDAGVGSDGPASSEDSGLAGDSGPDLTGGGPDSVDPGPDNSEKSETAKTNTDNKDSEASTSKESSESNNAESSTSEQGTEPTPPLGRITFVSCATGSEPTDTLPPPPPPPSNLHLSLMDSNSNEMDSMSPPRQRRLLKQFKEGLFKDGVASLPQENDLACEEVEKMSSVLPTMWLGAQNGYVFVHSAVSQWKRCIHSKQLKDSVLSIVHCGGRVICSLANCTLAVFSRGQDAQWDLSAYHLVDLGPPQPMHSIRCLAAVHSRLWAGYKNQIHILDPDSMKILRSVEVHPRKESQVRAMAWLGDGVWVSIRLDSTLRLYHAHTYQHLQDVDIEPYVSKMLGTGKLGFSFARITSLLIACSRLWIGTGNGVIISVPLSDSSSGVKVYADPDSSQITPATFIPYCSMQHAQLSFHGHRDSVKFFVAVPGCGGVSSVPVIDNAERPASMLVMSGGEGYVDFRVADDIDEEKDAASHLIVWQLLAR